MAEGELQLILDTLNPFHIYSTMFRVLDQRRIQGGGKGGVAIPPNQNMFGHCHCPSRICKRGWKKEKEREKD